MSLILNIDTASENAHVSLAKNGRVLYALSSGSQKEHASFLQPAIKELIKMAGINMREVNAVAVTAGPGSYTGLRVSMASAKGLCYALKIPLLTIGTLKVLTVSALQLYPPAADETILFCPMMDARRMEVFTAIYHPDLSVYLQPCALILDEFSFEKDLLKNKIMFFGSGSEKWKNSCPDSYRDLNALFKSVSIMPEAFSKASNTLFLEKKFTDLAYSEPLYLKEFQAFM